MGILITRPGEQGRRLTEQLNKAGALALHFPLFTVSAGRELNELPNALNRLNAGDYVVSVSRNASFYADRTLRDVGFCWRKDLQYFAVGKGSAAALSSAAEQPVHYPNRQETSEGLLALTAMQPQQLEDKSILLLRGNGGRELFSQETQKCGAKIEIIECYQRVPIEYPNPAEQISLLQRSNINSILVTNTESLTYLIDFVPENEHNWLKKCQLITVSQRIADPAVKFGWHNVIISPHADNASLLHTVLANQSI